MMEQDDLYKNHINWMTTQNEQVSSKITHVSCIRGCECRDVPASMRPAFTFIAYFSSDWLLEGSLLSEGDVAPEPVCVQERCGRQTMLNSLRSIAGSYKLDCRLWPCAVRSTRHACAVWHTAHLWSCTV